MTIGAIPDEPRKPDTLTEQEYHYAAVAFRLAEVFMAGTGSGWFQSYRLHCGQTLGSFRFRFSHA
jgi:hypothetical protein